MIAREVAALESRGVTDQQRLPVVFRTCHRPVLGVAAGARAARVVLAQQQVSWSVHRWRNTAMRIPCVCAVGSLLGAEDLERGCIHVALRGYK